MATGPVGDLLCAVAQDDGVGTGIPLLEKAGTADIHLAKYLRVIIYLDA